jgi:hypothetical protein
MQHTEAAPPVCAEYPLDTTVGAIGGEERLYTFHGVEHKTIGQCGWNGGWVKDCMGESVLEVSSDRGGKTGLADLPFCW